MNNPSASTARPGPRTRANPIIRLFSSVWLGIALLFLILAYASVFSALAWLRGVVELTEMRAFSHWVFVVLIVLFSINLTVATLRRIRWSVINAGVLTVHAGLLLLCGGALVYFSQKTEGDMLLRCPKIEVRTIASQNSRTIGEIAAKPNETWSQFMPAFGGRVTVQVLDAKGDGGVNPVTEATVVVKVGDEPAKKHHLVLANNPISAVSDRLAVRLQAFEPERLFYDDERVALYARKLGDSKWSSVTEIEQLPVFHERFLDTGETIVNRKGEVVESKRTEPVFNLFGFNLWTGWFEPWRMPIKLDVRDLPFDVTIDGYLPYCVAADRTASGGGSELNPAMTLRLSDGRNKVAQSLFAFDPRRDVLDTTLPFEFKWVKSRDEIDALARPIAGPHELTIEVKNPPTTKTLAVSAGQKIELPEAGYTLTVKDFSPGWPLMSPGFEGAKSPMASVDVVGPEKSFNRTVIQRFPQFTQDIDETGKRHKDALYDDNIIITYRSAPRGWAYVAAGEGIPPELVILVPGNETLRTPLPVGEPKEVPLFGVPLNVTVAGLFPNGREAMRPLVEPLEMRRPMSRGRAAPVIRVALQGRGGHSDWHRSEWLFQSNYAHLPDDGSDFRARPVVVTGPDGVDYELLFSRLWHDIGAQIAARELDVDLFPGGQQVEAWRSEIAVKPEGADKTYPGEVKTNATYTVGKWTLFQSGAAGDNWSYTILGVGNREGIWPMVIGCVLITLGCLYAFYIKPILRKRQASRARRREELEWDDIVAEADAPREAVLTNGHLAGAGVGNGANGSGDRLASQQKG